LRVYSAEPWEATLEDVNLVQALAQISGMGLELARLYKGLKSSIEILKAKPGPQGHKIQKMDPLRRVFQKVLKNPDP